MAALLFPFYVLLVSGLLLSGLRNWRFFIAGVTVAMFYFLAMYATGQTLESVIGFWVSVL